MTELSRWQFATIFLMIRYGRKALEEEPDEDGARVPERAEVPAIVY
jgi:hypothetical protein